MTTTMTVERAAAIRQPATRRAEALATTLELGASALASFAATLTDDEWTTVLPRDGRTIGVVVHHVATMYPIEIELAQLLARGAAIAGVTWDGVDAMNARHARDHAGVTKTEALSLLAVNSAAAAAAIRALTDDQLDTAAPNSLYGDATLTCQFMIEDHAMRHAWHHLGRLRAAVRR